jgi:SMODS-associating 2TM, beta-strand rich effector domain
MNFKYYKTEFLIIFIVALYFPCSFLSEWLEPIFKRWTMIDSIVKMSHSFSTLTLMSIGFIFVNEVGWKLKIFKWLVDLPNLNGRYKGRLLSTFLDPDTGKTISKECVIEIRQNASRIHLSAYFSDDGAKSPSSSSHSVSEQLVRERSGFFKLYYIYVNDTGFLEGEVRNHTGTSYFLYYPDIKTLHGDYYNQRLNKGEFSVVFQQRKKLGRFKE